MQQEHVASHRGRLSGASVVVIGAGVVGANISYRLAQAGANVVVVHDSDTGGATGSSFAWTNAFGKFPRDYWELNVAGMRDYWELQSECGGDWFHPVTSLRWESDERPDLRAELQQNAQQSIEWGATVEMLDPSLVIRELEPSLTIDPARVDIVYRFVNEGWVDTAAMCRQLLETAERRFGARTTNDRVVSIEGGMPCRVGLQSGATLEADVVVVAAGTFSPGLAALAGTNLPVGSLTSALMTTTPVASTLTSIVATESLWLRPTGTGRIVIGSSSLPSGSTLTEADEQAIQHTLAVARSVLPALQDAQVERVRPGTQPVPADNFPIVGFDPEVEGLFFAVTRSGVSLAPRIAKLVVSSLLDTKDDYLASMGPARFLDSAPGRMGPAAEA